MESKLLCIVIGQALICQVFTANVHNLQPSLQQYILSSLGQSSAHPTVSVAKQPSPYNAQTLTALASLLGSSSLQSLPKTSVAPISSVAPSVSSSISPSISSAIAPSIASSIAPYSSILSSLSSPSTSSSILSSLSSPSTSSSILSSVSEGSPNLSSLVALSALLGNPSTHSHTTALSPANSHIAPQSSPESSLDASLLNNLAIALQLLLVSNMLNTPHQESTPEQAVSSYPAYESKEPVAPVSVSYAHSQPATSTPASKPPVYEQIQTPYNYYETVKTQSYPQTTTSHFAGSSGFDMNPTPSYPQMPNAHFVGSSGFEMNPFGGTIPPPSSSRSGYSLMSPYEALSPSSPYMDPIISSPYGSVMTSKKDFQSPYAAIMAADNKDTFSFSDFF